MKPKVAIYFLAGFIAGIFITYLILAQGRAVKESDLLAEIDGKALTRTQLKTTLGFQFIPIENDEYTLLSNAVSNWLEGAVIQQEASSRNISPEELYQKELWPQVHVTSAAVVENYSKNAPLYGNQPLENIRPSIERMLRDQEFFRIKKDFIQKLSEKYHAKNYLQKPASYVPGLGLTPPTQAPTQAAPPAPAARVTFNDLDGHPSVGPAQAPITLVEFSDFHCPFCKNLEPTIDQLMKNYPGKIRKVWRHFPLPMHQGSDHTHVASECAFEQSKFWEYHGKLFETQGGARDDAALTQLAEQVGLNKEKFQACLTANRHMDVVQKDMAKGQEVGVQGTPAVFLNGILITGAQPYQNFAKMIDGLLDPSKAAQMAAPGPPAAPPPAPTNVVFDDLDGRPAEGPKNAVITLVIFSDFYCPFCKRVEPTVDQLMKNYAGKIRKIWRHYPLPFHTGSARAHEASECANEQGKFWVYHGKLFETQGTKYDDAGLMKLAKDLGLDSKKFDACLTSNKYKDLIQKEIAKGSSVGVQGTPAIFVNGQLVSGSQPYENFDAVIKQKLNK